MIRLALLAFVLALAFATWCAVIVGSRADRRSDAFEGVAGPPARGPLRVVRGNEAEGAGPARTPGAFRPRTGPYAAPVPPDDPAA